MSESMNNSRKPHPVPETTNTSAATTGDDSHIGMYLAEMVGAAGVIAYAARKKEKDDPKTPADR